MVVETLVHFPGEKELTTVGIGDMEFCEQVAKNWFRTFPKKVFIKIQEMSGKYKLLHVVGWTKDDLNRLREK